MAGVANVVGDALAIDALGTKVSFTAPPQGARVTSYAMFSTGTLFVWEARVVRGAVTISLFQSAVATSKSVDVASIPLQGGDVFQLGITTIGAAGNTGDFSIGIDLVS